MMVLPDYAILVPAAVVVAVLSVAAFFHERNWRRVLAEYADLRRQHGAPAGRWPSFSLQLLLGLKPGLLVVLALICAGGAVIGAWAALAWPQPAPFAVLPVADANLPVVWAATGGAGGFTVALLAVVVLVATSPWSRVSRALHRAIPAKGEQRLELLGEALAADPQIASAASDRD